MVDELRRVLLSNLQDLRAEVRAYPNEALLWATPPGISNSAGTLALHLLGNLQHYFGATLGGTGYIRDRTAEFSDRDVPLSVIEHRIDATIRSVQQTLDGLDEAALEEDYPEEIAGARLPTRLFLTHLVSHTAYHLGQIDYHRRLVTGLNRPVTSSIRGVMEAT